MVLSLNLSKKTASIVSTLIFMKVKKIMLMSIENENDLQHPGSRYIDANEPICAKLLFLSPICSRKGAYPSKTRRGERRYLKSGTILDYLRCK